MEAVNTDERTATQTIIYEARMHMSTTKLPQRSRCVAACAARAAAMLIYPLGAAVCRAKRPDAAAVVTNGSTSIPQGQTAPTYDAWTVPQRGYNYVLVLLADPVCLSW
eukprot:scaffold302856_cov25-Prasinocladus_malaysianus.AAC.1